MFEGTNRLLQESQAVWRQQHEQSQSEWRQQREESRRQREETERFLQELADRRAADRAETERLFREERALTERSFRELNEQQKETDRKIKEVSVQIGNLGGRWGEFVEGLIAPACIALFTERGLQVDEVYTRAKKTVAGKRMEIDILVANTVDAVLVEVKSQLQVENVRTHLERIAQFKTFFTRYANCRVYGAVAGIVVESEADQYAINQGLFVIEQSGETVRLANDAHFRARVW
ncbi:MAG: DUF3782 domain-containing protein [Magnetococcales bacterium]|nr:DUF3782 domain-containing protein [Magnetococcales bacterium]MBF0114218.1 DUF3782 domain-containing protein [Magnetococcales bacterium]